MSTITSHANKLALVAILIAITAAATTIVRQRDVIGAALTCDTRGIHMRSVSREINYDATLSDQPTIISSPSPTDTEVTAWGPVLGSMDAPKVPVTLVCTATGMSITATITRSAAYNGGAIRNIHWRPKLVIAVPRTWTGDNITVRWNMRLSNGTNVDHAESVVPTVGQHRPPFGQQTYPIVVTATLRTPDR